MRNKLKSTLLGLVSILFLSSASAQFDSRSLSFGANLGYISYGSAIGSNLGITFKGNYNLDEKSSINLGYTFMLPAKTSIAATANASSSTTNPRSVQVNVDQSVGFHNLYIDLHRYFVGENEDDFGIYGLAGVGLTIANVSYVVGSYDKSLYSFGFSDSYTDKSYNGLILNFGLGANYNISDQLALTAEFKLGLPVTETNSGAGTTSTTEIENPIPFNYQMGVGIRFSPF